MKENPPAAALIPRKSRGNLKNYFKEVVRELHKVEWTPAREVTRLTLVVLIVCALVVGILWVGSVVAGTLVSILQGKG